jgi:hypothetical protein
VFYLEKDLPLVRNYPTERPGVRKCPIFSDEAGLCIPAINFFVSNVSGIMESDIASRLALA